LEGDEIAIPRMGMLRFGEIPPPRIRRLRMQTRNHTTGHEVAA